MVDDKDVGDCWDYFNCPQEDKEKCLAYLQNKGDRCWEVAMKDTCVMNSGVGTYEGVKKCWECAFFRARKHLVT